MYSTSSLENQYLDIFVSHGLSASINIPTHKAGITLDNTLLENVNQFDDFMVIKYLFLSDHYPILFNCLISSSFSKPTPLASSNSFNSAKEISTFIDSWSYFTFTDFPSSATVDSFYSHLNFIISQTFNRKTKKRLNNPFYYSSHSMHCLNLKETAQRKCIRNPSTRILLMLERAKEDFSMSVELDKISFFSGSFTHNTSDAFSFLNSLKIQCLPSSMKYNLTLLTNDLDIANSFNEYFSSSFNSQTYPSSAPLCPCDIFLEDIFDSMTIESIYRKILAMKSAGTVLSDNLPPLLVKLCPELYAHLLFILFSAVIHTLVYPGFWKTAYTRPLHKSESKTDITNYRPISLIPKVSLIFEKNMFDFLFTKIKHRITPSQHGFQSRKSAVLQLIDFLETARLKHSPNLYSVLGLCQGFW